MENRKRLEALPAFLQPKFRLFLSVDLVGSTASKQRPRFPIQTPERLWVDGGMAPPWLSPIANFFGGFQEEFVREWKNFKAELAKKLGLKVAIDPSFWKANGDELIFVKELDDRKEILGCIDAWMKALKSLRPKLMEKGLDLKATAWTAGFPVTNSELIFYTNPGAPDALFEDDHRLRQFALLEKFHENKDLSSANSVIIDFIGPSIDIGFRLATQSTPRRFVVSIDIAYFLVTAHLPPGVPLPRIFYSGRVELKGVLGGKPYPVFWIDTLAGDTFSEKEDSLLGIRQASKEDIQNFCEGFYKEHSGLMFRPFIFRESESQYGEFPENYILALEHLRDRWSDEKLIALKVTEVESAMNGSETLSEAESAQKEDDILSALTEGRSRVRSEKDETQGNVD
ncbi:hypothetical protein [Bradyrhizobium sp.]|uniref:hypothetical protein n=1 Tax=Bradyrhizobium sp. TaxID=376 RepID=UPI004037A686